MPRHLHSTSHKLRKKRYIASAIQVFAIEKFHVMSCSRILGRTMNPVNAVDSVKDSHAYRKATRCKKLLWFAA